MERVVARIDQWLLSVAIGVREYFTLGQRAARFSVTRPFYALDTLRQMDRLGAGSVPILLLTGSFTGMVLALHSSIELERFGATVYVGNLVGASMIRELGPVLAGLMVAGRAASGIAAELGSMRASEQIEAMESMGTDPIRKLVTPRLVAVVVMLPALTAITDAVGILGGMLIAVHRLDLTYETYLRGVVSTIAQSGLVFGYIPRDFILGLTKPVVFGAIIALTGSYYGLAVTGGTEGVGRATTRSVVMSSILILAVNFFLTQLLIALLYEV
ncbi:MAG TPA: ABC transporter permease [Longimicrobiales bacterium]|nr:ABC transporter permease [Longimicrobiales bacterium]